MEMNHIPAHHVMSLIGISEIVNLHAGILASTQKSETVLRNTGGVVITVDYLQATFEIFAFKSKLLPLYPSGFV